MRSLPLCALIAILALAACGPTPAGPTPPTATRGPGAKPSGSAAPATTPTPTPTPAVAASATVTPASAPPVVASLAPIAPGQSVAPTLAVLAGKVLAPSALVVAAGGIISDKGAGILSNNSGSLITNNGSNVIANNSAGFRLLQAAADVPLVNAVIRLEDASGQPVLGADGKAVVAMTDAEGRYAFAGVRPGRHLVVKAELPVVGSLSRIVAPAVADAPLDVASTLATAYILERFVGSQADRQATLDRLPADVEAETVLVAGKAAAGTAPLVTLATAEVVAKVEALRKADTTLDAQMEKVKKLLILAGSSNLGAGEVATTVALRRMYAIWPNADGSAYLQVAEDSMLWRLDPDGRLRAVAGRAATGPGAAVTVGEAALTVDAKGRLLFGGTEGSKLWRLTPGATPEALKVEDLTGDLKGLVSACPLDGDDVLAFTWTPQREDPKVWLLRTGQPAKLLHTETDGKLIYAGARRVIRRADGTIRVAASGFLVPDIYDFDLATAKLTKRFGWSSALGIGLQLGNDGEAYYSLKDEATVRRWVDGDGDPVVPDLLPADLAMFTTFGLAPTGGGAYVMGGGSAISSKNVTLSLRKGGVLTHVAGLTSESATAGPGVVTLSNPTAFAVEPDGDLLVVDNGVLSRVKPGGNPVPLTTVFKDGETVLVPTGAFTGSPGGTFISARENSGSIFQDNDAIFQLAADDTSKLVFRAQGSPLKAVQLPDGSLYVAATDANSLADFRGSLHKLTPDGVPTELLASSQELANLRLWLDAGRPVYAKPIYGTGGAPTRYIPKRYEPDGTVSTLPEVLDPPAYTDLQGRSYTVGATITRTDAAGAKTILAGPGGKVFAGTGVDDALGAASELTFGPEGDLYFLDKPNRQIKRIPKDLL